MIDIFCTQIIYRDKFCDIFMKGTKNRSAENMAIIDVDRDEPGEMINCYLKLIEFLSLWQLRDSTMITLRNAICYNDVVAITCLSHVYSQQLKVKFKYWLTIIMRTIVRLFSILVILLVHGIPGILHNKLLIININNFTSYKL